MFKQHYDSMRPDPTPERVYSVCKLAALLNGTKAEVIKAALLYNELNNAQPVVEQSINVAIELKILAEKEGHLILNVPAEILQSYISFRRYASAYIFSKSGTTFFKVTEWYISKNEEIFKNIRWEDMAADAIADGVNSITENDMLGWRFWASFLGIGQLHNTVIIPNMYIRILDSFHGKIGRSILKNTPLSAKEFVAWLLEAVPEAKKGFKDDTLSLAISNGLRTLHELNIIELIVQKDATRVALNNIDGYAINDFSHVFVKEVDFDELG